MTLFSQNQIEELLRLISYHQTLFIAKTIGSDVLSESDLKILKENGIHPERFKEIPILHQAFKFGVLAQALGDKAAVLSYDDFKEYIKKGKFIPLTKPENLALQRVKFQAYKDIKALGNKFGDNLYQRIIEKESSSAVENRKTVRELVLELASKTDDWERDFGRISDYIMHSSYEEGRVAYISSLYGSDSLIYRDVYPGACKYCVGLYLTAGIGSQPKLFKLSEIQANGTNIGLKPVDWKPVINSTHPHCRCTWNNLPSGYVWNQRKGIFEAPPVENKIGRKAKIKISIGDKKYEV